MAAQARAYRKSSEGKLAAKKAVKKYQKSEKGIQNYKKYYNINASTIAQRNSEWRKKYPEKNANIWRRWRKNNPKHFKNLVQKRRLKLKTASLGIYFDQMQKLEAKCSAQSQSLDHIIPLQGKFISGLNVPWNAQILSFEQNRRKNNWFNEAAYKKWLSDPSKLFLRPKI
jgi:5-methylcytosine-specific restriction endonuclease McrA